MEVKCCYGINCGPRWLACVIRHMLPKAKLTPESA